MADEKDRQPVTQPVVNIPGLRPVPYIAIQLPSGEIALRHPSELQKLPSMAKPKGAQ